MHGVWVLSEQIEADCSGIFAESATGRPWYGLQVASNMERRACIWLRRRQFQPYWPRFKGWAKLSRHRRIMRWRSVIPGYLFLPICRPQDDNFPLIEKAPGIRGAMRNGGGEYVKIPEFGAQGIERIKQIEAALNESAIAAAEGIPFKVGQRVNILGVDVEAKVKKIEGRRKIVIEAEFLGALREWEIASHKIEAI